MSLKTSLSVLFFSILPLAVAAQSASYHHVQQIQKNIQNSIKGTLDGVIKAPKHINNARQLVFPRNLNNNYTVNPWSHNKPKMQNMPAQHHNTMPKGNPWAPMGAPNLPFNQNNMMNFEKNPYTDAPVPRQFMPSSNYSSMPFGGFQNQFSPFNNGYLDSSRGAFSSPFGDSFSPVNQFWPGGNQTNGSFPFMPW